MKHKKFAIYTGTRFVDLINKKFEVCLIDKQHNVWLLLDTISNINEYDPVWVGVEENELKLL